MKPDLCIYHANCTDGFGAAWAVWKRFGAGVEYVAAQYGEPPPNVAGKNVVMVDFSYKRSVLLEMAAAAKTILILDHHKTAQEDLAGFREPAPDEWKDGTIAALFDMERSGAGITWDFFHPGIPRPHLINHVEDRDLWRFKIPGTREFVACLFSHPYDFPTWDRLAHDDPAALIAEGSAIERQTRKHVETMLPGKRPMTIGGHTVPVVNAPGWLASDIAGALATEAPFGACYFDIADKRVFSLRSRGDFDVSAIAKMYGGGGHKNAAGFQRPHGWDGDNTPPERDEIIGIVLDALADDSCSYEAASKAADRIVALKAAASLQGAGEVEDRLRFLSRALHGPDGAGITVDLSAIDRAAALIQAQQKEIQGWRECAKYDATMGGPVFKSWDRSALDRMRRRVESTKQHHGGCNGPDGRGRPHR